MNKSTHHAHLFHRNSFYDKLERIDNLCSSTAEKYNSSGLIPKLKTKNGLIQKSDIETVKNEVNKTFKEIKHYFFISSIKPTTNKNT